MSRFLALLGGSRRCSDTTGIGGKADTCRDRFTPTPAQGNDPAATIIDGKDHATAEAIVRLALVLGPDGKASLDDLVDRNAFALESGEEAVARVGREAQAEIVDGRFLQAATTQVVQALASDRQA